MIDLEEIKNTKQKITMLLDFCNNDDKDIVVMPAGAHAQQVVSNYLDNHKIKCSLFVDNNIEKQGKKISGIDVISFEKLKTFKKNVKVVIATNLEIYEKIKQQIESLGLSYCYAGQQYCVFSSDEVDNSVGHILNNYQNYQNVYNLLEDEFSKKTLDNLIRYRYDFSNVSLLKDISCPTKNQYFEKDIYQIKKNDCIVDCGAYTGDTFKNCLEFSKGKFETYYAFEPDENNFKILALIDDKRLKSYKEGCFNESKTLSFASGESISALVSDGDLKINVIALDDKFADKKITFVKMDIEGAELSALKGAEKIIREQKPALAICVYHKFCDLWEILNFIKSIGIDYKYYLRHYTNYMSETVLYAIPKQK